MKRLKCYVITIGMVWCAGAHAAPVTVNVEGLEDAPLANVEAYLAKPPSVEGRRGAQAYADRAEATARRALQAVGYYNATIKSRLEPADEGWRLVLDIDPGEPVRLRHVSVSLHGEGERDSGYQQVVENLPLAEGDVLNHGDYETAKNRLQTTALSRGYFDFAFKTSRVAVNTEENWADITLTADTGPRYELGRVEFRGNLPFNKNLLRRLVPYEPGTPYLAQDVAALNRNLLDSGYFGDVQVTTQRDQASDGGEIPVRAKLTAREPNSIGFGAGYSTDEGARVSINWDRYWLNAAGHKANALMRISQVRQNITGEYTIPLSDPLNDELQFQAGLQHEDIEDTESTRYTVAARRRQTFDSGWERVQSLRLLHEDFTQADQSDRSTLLMPGISFSRTRSRGGADPFWGDRQNYSLEVAAEPLLSDANMARVLVGTKWLRTYFKRHRILLRADGGAIATNDFSAIPPSLRFFAGGDNSVRGYGYRTLAPENEDGDLVGGRYLVSGSAEYGYQFLPSWRAAVFVDAGNAFDDANPDFKIGSGFGLRWLSPVGPVRVDFAWGVSESNPPFRVHISLGPTL